VCRSKTRSSSGSLAAALAAAAALLGAACNVVVSQPRRPSRDGYRAIFVSSDGSRRPIAVRATLRRLEETGAPVVRILDTAKRETILLRTDRKEYFEGPSEAADEVAPGYDLVAGFDPKARFAPGTSVRDLGDDVQAGHVCALYRVWGGPADSVIYWAAKDLDALVVRMEWQHLELGEFQETRMEELVGVRPGADPSLFTVPNGFTRVPDRAALRR